MEKAKDFLQKKRNRVAVAFAAAVILGIAVYFMTNSGEDSAENANTIFITECF